jgi:hypothetical protein
MVRVMTAVAAAALLAFVFDPSAAATRGARFVGSPGIRLPGPYVVHHRRVVFLPGPIGTGYPFGAQGSGCLVPRTVVTPFGPGTEWINICYPYNY